jgi:hypothetical protein
MLQFQRTQYVARTHGDRSRGEDPLESEVTRRDIDLVVANAGPLEASAD